MAKRNVTSIRSKRSARPSGGNHRPSEQQIAARAYEIYLSCGAVHGRALDDWLQAEQELLEGNREPVLAVAQAR